MSNGVLDELKQVKDITAQEILNAMLDGDENLDLKTHIYKPKQLASLNLVGDLLKGLKYKRASKTIENFIEIYLRYMVSYKRMSRQEIIKALSHMIEIEEKSRLSQDLS